MQLSKGFEIELYTGTPAGQTVGLSDRISADLHGFVREPDNRNVEYTTPPRTSYDRLLCDLLRPRQELRRYLHRIGNFTLHPGSTLSLGDSRQFYRSDPANPYHDFIERSYGTRVVTASIHINIGIENPEALMRACRLIRVEAPLFLALSAASPFLDGQVTGWHSTRWQLFPQTPSFVPLFESHAHFIKWTEQQLVAGTMQNVRHLWSSVRPNGERRPYCLNRLELRICDLVTDPLALLAITALIEARIWQTLEDPDLDPLRQSKFTAMELVELTYANELAAAKHSLDAELRDWQTGQLILASDWVRDLWAMVRPMAKAKAFNCFLSPLECILTDGNTAQQWLRQIDQGLTPQEVMVWAIAQMENQEHDLEDKLCAGTPALAGVG